MLAAPDMSTIDWSGDAMGVELKKSNSDAHTEGVHCRCPAEASALQCLSRLPGHHVAIEACVSRLCSCCDKSPTRRLYLVLLVRHFQQQHADV